MNSVEKIMMGGNEGGGGWERKGSEDVFNITLFIGGERSRLGNSVYLSNTHYINEHKIFGKSFGKKRENYYVHSCIFRAHKKLMGKYIAIQGGCGGRGFKLKITGWNYSWMNTL